MCDQCIRMFNKTWHVKDKGYYVTTVYLHRDIWEQANGPIPAGYQVHHKNHDKTDNRLENLELLTLSEHRKAHPEHLPKYRAKAIAGSIAATARARAARMLIDRTCALCGTTFHSGATHPSRYCSSACIDRARSGAFTGEQRLCARCGTEYTATKRTQLYCSKKCNTRATADRAKDMVERPIACAQCGTEFKSKRLNARFCTHACALSFHSGNKLRHRLSDIA